MEGTKQINLNANILPVYTDGAICNVGTTWKPDKSDKNGKKALKKEYMVKVLFIDTSTNIVVSNMVMNTINAENLIEALQKSLEFVVKDSKTDKIPEMKEVTASTTHEGYIG